MHEGIEAGTGMGMAGGKIGLRDGERGLILSMVGAFFVYVLYMCGCIFYFFAIIRRALAGGLVVFRRKEVLIVCIACNNVYRQHVVRY